MERFERLEGIAAPFPEANIDTDKIFPACHLSTIRRTGLGRALFSARRFDADGKEKPSFILNRVPWREAVILVTGPNFGCGSSREHAPWALHDFGIRCIIASGFAEIFRNNCVKNGILPVVLGKDKVEMLLEMASDPARARFVVDLVAQRITLQNGKHVPFATEASSRSALLEGRDEIADTMCHAAAEIACWEKQATPLPPVTAEAWRRFGESA